MFVGVYNVVVVFVVVFLGWGGVKSDLGIGHRRQRSKSPPERETFSDVGVMHPQQV
jgi:hypothetical protein